MIFIFPFRRNQLQLARIDRYILIHTTTYPHYSCYTLHNKNKLRNLEAVLIQLTANKNFPRTKAATTHQIRKLRPQRNGKSFSRSFSYTPYNDKQRNAFLNSLVEILGFLVVNLRENLRSKMLCCDIARQKAPRALLSYQSTLTRLIFAV